MLKSRILMVANLTVLAFICGCGTHEFERNASLNSKPVDSSAAEPEMAGKHSHAKTMMPPSPTEPTTPGSRERFDTIVENDFFRAKETPLSTFSIDVDTASYSKVRQYLLELNRLPPADAVRIEEFVNYFTYDYPNPTDESPFHTQVDATICPWQPDHHLVRIGIQGKRIDTEKRPASNLVFLLDVSGSMGQPNKLPLLQYGLKQMVDRLGENDRVSIVVYASAAGLVLPSTTCDHKADIVDALQRLNAGGSTNGGQGIHLAYQTALDNFIQGGVNRVFLCTDGDFNVGTTDTDDLVRLAEEQAKTGVFLTVLGFGRDNLNDSLMEQLSNKANGNYAFIDTRSEANRVLVEQMSGTLVTIAKDVKIQVEFNPTRVNSYRLIGYENRMLAAQDFNDDSKDAGEIGAGHRVTALYEVIPTTSPDVENQPSIDELKYQETKPISPDATAANELLTVKLRYKEPDGDTSKLLEFPLTDDVKKFGEVDADFRFASAVASFGLLLRNSKYQGDASFASVLEIASESANQEGGGFDSYRDQFLDMVRQAERLTR